MNRVDKSATHPREAEIKEISKDQFAKIVDVLEEKGFYSTDDLSLVMCLMFSAYIETEITLSQIGSNVRKRPKDMWLNILMGMAKNISPELSEKLQGRK